MTFQKTTSIKISKCYWSTDVKPKECFIQFMQSILYTYSKRQVKGKHIILEIKRQIKNMPKIHLCLHQESSLKVDIRGEYFQHVLLQKIKSKWTSNILSKEQRKWHTEFQIHANSTNGKFLKVMRKVLKNYTYVKRIF